MLGIDKAICSSIYQSHHNVQSECFILFGVLILGMPHGNYWFLDSVGFRYPADDPLLQLLHLQQLVTVPHVDFQMLDILHYLQHFGDHQKHKGVENLHLFAERLLREHHARLVVLLILFRNFLQVILFRHKTQEHLRFCRSVPPPGNFQPYMFLVQLPSHSMVNSLPILIKTILDKSLKCFHEFFEVWLSILEYPVWALQREILEILIF